MVLLLLADVPGLLAREQMRDRAGRPSIEVILPYTDTQGTPARYMLAFDPGTGVLLASWTAVTGPSVSPDPQRGPVDLERQRARIDTVYRLYVTSTFASSTETPAGGCPSPTGAR
jgi:hypothetical protein